LAPRAFLGLFFRQTATAARIGSALIGAELGQRYGIKDLDGKQPRVYSDLMGKPSGRFIIPKGV
jgi:hypothetical protein